jgi:hypothetical protein
MMKTMMRKVVVLGGKEVPGFHHQAICKLIQRQGHYLMGV